jgi:hypothetical protein
MADRKIASVRPSPLASWAGIAGGVVGMGFGLVFLASVPSEPGPDGFRNFFFLIWFLVCGGMIVYYARNLASFRKEEAARVPLTASEVVELEQDEACAVDFAERLRKLEGLRKDGLVSEEEFQAKRREIMGEKW